MEMKQYQDLALLNILRNTMSRNNGNIWDEYLNSYGDFSLDSFVIIPKNIEPDCERKRFVDALHAFLDRFND